MKVLDFGIVQAARDAAADRSALRPARAAHRGHARVHGARAGDGRPGGRPRRHLRHRLPGLLAPHRASSVFTAENSDRAADAPRARPAGAAVQPHGPADPARARRPGAACLAKDPDAAAPVRPGARRSGSRRWTASGSGRRSGPGNGGPSGCRQRWRDSQRRASMRAMRSLPSRLALALAVLSAVPASAPAQQRQPTQKPQLHARHWIAITGKPLGATAGAMMFARGGNAVDAACAMLAAVTTMWDVLSWGGETQALIYHPKLKKVIGINALGVAPTGATAGVLPEPGLRVPAGVRPARGRHAGHAGRTDDHARRVRDADSGGRPGSRDPDGRGVPDRGADRRRDRGREGAHQAVEILHRGLPPSPRRRAGGAGRGRGLRPARPRRHAPQAGRGRARGTANGEEPEAGDLRRIRPLL